MHETHVNLSHQPLWLKWAGHASTSSGSGPEMPIKPGQQVSFTLYPDVEGVESKAFPYDGSRLREGAVTYLAFGPAPGHAEERASSGRDLPLVRLPYPDLRALTRYAPESELLVHQYFHYDDRVEVAPGLKWRMVWADDPLFAKAGALTMFHVSNRLAPAVARVEVNGQTLELASISTDIPCADMHAYQPAGLALVDPGQPLRVRWQTLDAPGRWREAPVAVPPLRAPARGRDLQLPGVLLYFTSGGQVAVEHFRLLGLPGDQSGLLASGLPAGVPTSETCGSAESRFNMDFVKRLPP
jgi:hypothetical protein